MPTSVSLPFSHSEQTEERNQQTRKGIIIILKKDSYNIVIVDSVKLNPCKYTIRNLELIIKLQILQNNYHFTDFLQIFFLGILQNIATNL